MALSVSTVDLAIESILSDGQTVSVDGTSYSAANLNALIALRDKLKIEADRANRPTLRAINFGAMGY